MKRSEFIQKLLDAAPADVDPEIALGDWTMNCYFPSINAAEAINYKRTKLDGKNGIFDAIVVGDDED